MKVRITNRRAAEASYREELGDDNIFNDIQDDLAPRAIVPPVEVSNSAAVLRPEVFRADRPDRVTTTTPDVLRGVACASGHAKVITPEGAMPIGHLQTGSLVLTRDNGFQPVLWCADITGTDAVPAQIEIAQNTLATGKPSEPLRVSGRQRVLLQGPDIAACFGKPEVLVRAGDLLHLDGFERVEAEKHVPHMALLFQNHEVLRVNDIWLDSLQPDTENMRYLNKAQTTVISELLPDLKTLPIDRVYPAARPVLRTSFARQVSL